MNYKGHPIISVIKDKGENWVQIAYATECCYECYHEPTLVPQLPTLVLRKWIRED